MNKLGSLILVITIMAMALGIQTPVAFAQNDWAVGNLIGLCSGTPIHTGPGDNYTIHTYVPENNWTVKVIDGPRTVNGSTWWDTSRKAAGDPSGGTGWVKQSEADSCNNGGGGPGDSGGGGSEQVDYLYSNPHNDTISTASPLSSNQPPAQAVDGFQWPFSNVLDAGKNATGLYFGAPDSHCVGKLHDGVDYNAGNSNFIYSIGTGKVIRVKWDQPKDNWGYGLYIVVWHIAPNGESIYSVYGHLEQGTALVKVGQQVNRGDPIARQDTSGGANHQSHLHFEIRKPNLKGGALGTEGSIFGYSSCPANDEELNQHFYNPITYISTNWFEKFNVSQPAPSVETLKQNTTTALNQVATPSAYIQSTINQGDVAKFVFKVTVKVLYQILIHSIFGSATEFTIYRPDGSIYNTYELDNPVPLMVVIPNPELGDWSFTVKGVNIPYQNYPFVVGIGNRNVPFLDLSDSLSDTLLDVQNGDITAPITSLLLNPSIANGKNGWYVTPVNITLSALDNDNGVGVAEIRYEINSDHHYLKYESAFQLSLEGRDQIDYYSTDGMGNVSQQQTSEINIDLTSPIVSVYQDQPSYTRTQSFVVHYSGYDPMPGSGLYILKGLFNNLSVSDSQVIDMFWWPLGIYAESAKGEDFAGWVSTDQKSIELVATIESLQSTVVRLCNENFITKQGVCNSLLQKLDAALAARNRNQPQTVINILNALQAEVKAQTGKSVSPQANSILLMDSNYVINHLKP